MNTLIVEDCVCGTTAEEVIIIKVVDKTITPFEFVIPEYSHIAVMTHESNAPPKEYCFKKY